MRKSSTDRYGSYSSGNSSSLPGALPPRGGGPPTPEAPADPLPSIFSALQELGIEVGIYEGASSRFGYRIGAEAD
jgi:hypothetical protein